MYGVHAVYYSEFDYGVWVVRVLGKQDFAEALETLKEGEKDTHCLFKDYCPFLEKI